MDFLKYNSVILFLVISLCVLMSKYILNKTHKEMFMQAEGFYNMSNSQNSD